MSWSLVTEDTACTSDPKPSSMSLSLNLRTRLFVAVVAHVGPCKAKHRLLIFRSLGTAYQVTSPVYSEPGYLDRGKVGWLPGQSKGPLVEDTQNMAQVSV